MNCPTPDKVEFRSAAHARRYNRRRRPPLGLKKERMWPYLCVCGAWHLSHQTPAQQALWHEYHGRQHAE